MEDFVRRRFPGVFENTAFVADVEQIGVCAVRLGFGRGHGDPMLIGILNEFTTRSHGPFPPGSDDFELRGECHIGELKAYLIVSFSRGSMRHRFGAFFQRDLGLSAGDQRTGNRGAEQIAPFIHCVPS